MDSSGHSVLYIVLLLVFFVLHDLLDGMRQAKASQLSKPPLVSNAAHAGGGPYQSLQWGAGSPANCSVLTTSAPFTQVSSVYRLDIWL